MFSKLDKRLKFYKPTYSTNSYGERAPVYLHECSRWAAFMPFKEAFSTIGFPGKETAVFTMRYNGDISVDWRVEFKDNMYEITEINQLDNERKYIAITMKRLKEVS